MGKKRKYVMSNGLAFAENRDMEVLREYSKSGYHLKKLQFCFYILEKGDPKDYIYSIDYQQLKGVELEEYIEIANEGGWELIQQYEYILLLRAVPGTAPLYTDTESLASREKYSSFKLGKSVLAFMALTLIIVAWRFFIVIPVNMEFLTLLTDLLIGAMIGATAGIFIAFLNVKRKLKKYLN